MELISVNSVQNCVAYSSNCRLKMKRLPSPGPTGFCRVVIVNHLLTKGGAPCEGSADEGTARLHFDEANGYPKPLLHANAALDLFRSPVCGDEPGGKGFLIECLILLYSLYYIYCVRSAKRDRNRHYLLFLPSNGRHLALAMCSQFKHWPQRSQ